MMLQNIQGQSKNPTDRSWPFSACHQYIFINYRPAGVWRFLSVVLSAVTQKQRTAPQSYKQSVKHFGSDSQNAIHFRSKAVNIHASGRRIIPADILHINTVYREKENKCARLATEVCAFCAGVVKDFIAESECYCFQVGRYEDPSKITYEKNSLCSEGILKILSKSFLFQSITSAAEKC